jgi:hypothetical protein
MLLKLPKGFGMPSLSSQLPANLHMRRGLETSIALSTSVVAFVTGLRALNLFSRPHSLKQMQESQGAGSMIGM